MSWIIENIKNKGNQIAIVNNEKSYTYSKLADQIQVYYNEVYGVISPGATVSIVSDYNLKSIALFFALFKNKNVIVPITTVIKSDINKKERVSNCDYSITIDGENLSIIKLEVFEKVHDLIKDLQKNNSSGLILFSSGSTGTPKAMIHNLDNLIDSFKDKKSKNLVFLIFLMFDHIGGLNTLLNCISMGVTMVFPIIREPEHVCSLIEKYKVNILPASPTFLNLILISEAYRKYDLTSLRMVTYGTEPMPESLLLRLKVVLPRVKFLQTFGTSETGIIQASSKSSTSTYIKIEDSNSEFKIIDTELWIKSKTQILGYLNSSMERFTDDGWFKTGDLVEEMEGGFIKIIGRNSEVINVGGEKVLPSEVESILFQMPSIKDCIVFGESNPITGQMVVAKVLYNEPLKISEIKKLVVGFCKNKLERYKIPAKIILMRESEFSERFKKKRI
jgi:acyl-CoA synthetase (AMP-forming)/AMP-acid ligase II